jgi:dihydroneopterin aldolase
MDKVFLHGIEVETIIGVNEWERSVKQAVIIDLDMAADVAAAASSDRIEDALDYTKVAVRVRTFVRDASFHLVESLAHGIARILLEEFRVRWVRVVVNKRGAVTGAGDVGVIVERGEAR